MQHRYRKVLPIFLCAVLVGNAACSTTTQRVGASQAAMSNHGIGKGNTVLVRYANKDDPRSSSSSELLRITSLSNSGIVGIGENGSVVNVGYAEIFQIEHSKVKIKNLDKIPTLESALVAPLDLLVQLIDSEN